MSEVIHEGRTSVITKEGSGPDAVAVKRFTHGESSASVEIHTHTKLKEIPGVVDVISSSSTPPKMLVTEYCANGSLSSYMQRRGPFPEEELLRHFRGMVATVRSVHESRYVHRALLAENWLVTSEGEIKLTDFGYAKYIPMNDSLRQHSYGNELTNCVFVQDARKLGLLFLQIATMDFVPPRENVTPESMEQRFSGSPYSDRVKDIVRALLFDEREARQADVMRHFNGLLGQTPVSNPEDFLLYQVGRPCCSNTPCTNHPARNLPCTHSFCSACFNGYCYIGVIKCRICIIEYEDVESTAGRPASVSQVEQYQIQF